MTIYDTLRTSAEKYPEKAAIIDEYGVLTFQELFQQTENLKNELERFGLRKGCAMGIVTDNSRYFIISLYAGVGTGAVVMPVYNQLKLREIQNSAEEAALHFLLTNDSRHKEFGTYINSFLVDGHSLHLCQTKRSLNEPTAEFVDNPAFIRFTSGTTGKAKGVIISQQAVLERTEAANEGLKLSADDRVVWVLPMAYHFVVSISLYIRYGVGIIINNNFLAESVIESIQQHQGSLLYAAPMHVKLLANHNKEVELVKLKHVISTTTSISKEVSEAFKTKYKIPVSQAFGIIEVGLPIINYERSNEHPEAVGYALPAYEVAILNDSNEILPDGEEGILGIKGPGMFDAYLNPPIKREELLHNGWFITGDWAVKNPDGLILIKGRKKNVINVSGNKAFPEEIEEVLNTHPSVKLSRAFSHKHPLLGEVVAAEVILKKASEVEKEELISHCRKSLASFKVPQYIHIVDSITMTKTGKIQRI